MNPAEKWQQVADLISQLGLVATDQDQPRTAAQVRRMSTYHLLQDPVRAAIYHRGWADRTADIQRKLQPPTTASRPTTQHSPARPSRPQVAAKKVSAPSPSTPREPAPVPGPSGAAPTPVVKVRTEAQLARNKRKLKQLKEKRKARERLVSQQHRLTKHPAPTSEPEAASQPPSELTPPAAMEVDIPATEGEKPEEPVPPTSLAQPTATTDAETTAEDAWLAAPGLSLEGLPEMEYDKPFFTPVGSPNR